MIERISRYRCRRAAAWIFVCVAVSCISLARPAGATIERLFAPRKDLWPVWAAHDEASAARIDHATWQRLLDTYLAPDRAGVNRFAYARVSASDRPTLDAYLVRLAETPISHYSRDEQFAFWVNLYNALTVKVVLDHYPVRSIRDIDISPGLFASGPWDRKLITIEGRSISLDDIEHRILRPIWTDARVHYALNCASLGCPSLQARAFTGSNHEALLESAAREYVNSIRGVQIVDGRIVASSIYDWFQEDFGGNVLSVLEHLRRYAAPTLADALRQATRIDDYRYDWALNDQATE